MERQKQWLPCKYRGKFKRVIKGTVVSNNSNAENHSYMDCSRIKKKKSDEACIKAQLVGNIKYFPG